MFHFSWGIFDMTHRAYDDKIYNITNRLFDISMQPNVFCNMCNIYILYIVTLDRCDFKWK